MALVKNLEHFSRRGVPLLDWFPIRQNPSFLFMVHPILLKCSLVKAMEHYNRRIASTLANGYNKQCDQNGRILKVPLVTNEWRLFGQLWKSITSNLKLLWLDFGQFLDRFGLLFISKSGHTGKNSCEHFSSRICKTRWRRNEWSRWTGWRGTTRRRTTEDCFKQVGVVVVNGMGLWPKQFTRVNYDSRVIG